MSQLEFQDICFSYHTLEGETLAIHHLSFKVQKGEFIAIVGPSGCGKSTLLSLIAGLSTPTSGRILLNGLELNTSSTNIGYMLQHDYLLEWRSIFRNVTLGLEVQHKLTPKARQDAITLLKKYGVGDFTKSKPSQLSGGMRQRVALIRTLVLEPDLLLLDEPFSALDFQTRLSVSNDIGQIIRNERKTALLVTHDISEAISLADKILILTKRPASIKQTVTLSFPDLVHDTPLNRRNAPEFKSYFNLIWKELNHEITTSHTN